MEPVGWPIVLLVGEAKLFKSKPVLVSDLREKTVVGLSRRGSSLVRSKVTGVRARGAIYHHQATLAKFLNAPCGHRLWILAGPALGLKSWL